MQSHQGVDYTYDDLTLSLFHQYSNNVLLDKKYKKDDYFILNKYNSPTLTIMLLLSGLIRYDIKVLVIAHALISHGLAVHDEIDNYDYDDFNKQLKILAGDLYYAQYYNILANNNRISDIKLFSDAVGDINKGKMILHYSDITDYSLDDYFAAVEKSILSITYSLIDRYAVDNKFWKNICKNIYLANHLRQELSTSMKSNILDYKKSNKFNIYIVLLIKNKALKTQDELNSLLSNDAIIAIDELKYNDEIDQMIAAYKEAALASLESLPYENYKLILKKYIKSI